MTLKCYFVVVPPSRVRNSEPLVIFFTENKPVEQTFDLIFRINTFCSIIFIDIKIKNDHFALEQTQSWICNFIRIENGCLATFSRGALKWQTTKETVTCHFKLKNFNWLAQIIFIRAKYRIDCLFCVSFSIQFFNTTPILHRDKKNIPECHYH